MSQMSMPADGRYLQCLPLVAIDLSTARVKQRRIFGAIHGRTAVTTLGSRRIWSLNDLERAFMDRLQPENPVPAEAQLATLTGGNPASPAG